MTDADKAFELLNKLDFEDGKFEITDALIEMAEWKKQQMIDKVCEYLKRNYPYVFSNHNIEQFKQAMKGE